MIEARRRALADYSKGMRVQSETNEKLERSLERLRRDGLTIMQTDGGRSAVMTEGAVTYVKTTR